MQSTRVRFIESPSFAQLEQLVNAALAALEDDPAVAAIETIAYHSSVMGAGIMVSAMIVYRLAPPDMPATSAVAEAEAIIQEEQA